MGEEGGFTYKQAGVDVEAGNRAVELMKERLTSTRHPLVLGGLGGFGGAMRLPPLKDPVLVAGTDGVGTKIEIARRMGRLDTIGIDLVAMSVNDVSACGAVPLFFLDYLVTGKVVPEQVADIVAGVDEGCRRAQCVLLGGETAEHPGQFPDGDFDLAGFAVGLAERHELWGPGQVRAGDALVGIDQLARDPHFLVRLDGQLHIDGLHDFVLHGEPHDRTCIALMKRPSGRSATPLDKPHHAARRRYRPAASAHPV